MEKVTASSIGTRRTWLPASAASVRLPDAQVEPLVPIFSSIFPNFD
jgi:hypothetical protein